MRREGDDSPVHNSLNCSTPSPGRCGVYIIHSHITSHTNRLHLHAIMHEICIKFFHDVTIDLQIANSVHSYPYIRQYEHELVIFKCAMHYI